MNIQQKTQMDMLAAALKAVLDEVGNDYLACKEQVSDALAACDAPSGPMLWPDRPGFWWVKHHWGMELAQSFKNDDKDRQPEGPWLIQMLHGDQESEESYAPSDLSFGDVEAPQFVWLGQDFP